MLVVRELWEAKGPRSQGFCSQRTWFLRVRNSQWRRPGGSRSRLAGNEMLRSIDHHVRRVGTPVSRSPWRFVITLKRHSHFGPSGGLRAAATKRGAHDDHANTARSAFNTDMIRQHLVNFGAGLQVCSFALQILFLVLVDCRYSGF